jgi:ankyrin repeat protein
MVVIGRLESDITTAEKHGILDKYLFHASHTFRCLIHAGVDPTAATVSGDTALHAAAQEGHSQVMAYLLQLGLQVHGHCILSSMYIMSNTGQLKHRVHTEWQWLLFGVHSAMM